MATKATKATEITTKERLHRLVDQLDDARAEAMLVLLTPPNGASNGDDGDGAELKEDSEDIDVITARQRAELASMPPITADDPLWEIVGMATSGPGEPHDVAENHDEYLAEAYADLHEGDERL